MSLEEHVEALDINEKLEGGVLSFADSAEFDEQDWIGVFDEFKQLEDFKGNKSRAAWVLAKIGLGIRQTMEEFAQKGLKKEAPDIGIAYSSDSRSMVYDIDHKSVNIGIWFLEYLSDTKLNLNAIYEFERENGDVIYKGKIVEWILSMAQEEAHHSLYTQFKEYKPNVRASSMSVAEYDSMPIERRAQRWVIQQAKKLNFSPEAQEFLKERYENAGSLIKPKEEEIGKID